MRRVFHDRRGSTALEFSLIALPFFFILFGVFDIGRYAITVQSLRTLTSATGRAVMVSCYGPNVIQSLSPASCTADPLTTVQKQIIAPFLFVGGLAPSAPSIVAGANALTITITQTGFSMLLKPLFGTVLDNPSASVTLPF
jgi:hypothetical protein